MNYTTIWSWDYQVSEYKSWTVSICNIFVSPIEEFERVKNDDKEKDTVSDKFRKELEREKMMKSEAINKLAEIMNRKDMSKKESNRGNAMLLRKKDKECKKLQQELSRVSFTFLKVCAIHRITALFHSS